MADGDLAASVGFPVFTSGQDLRQGYNNDNIRGDEIAAHMLTGTHPQSAIVGLVAALGAKQASLGFTPVQQNGGSGMGTNKIYLGWNGTQLIAQVDLTPLGQIVTAGSSPTLGNIYTPAGRATPVVTSYVAAYLNSDGRIGATPSSIRFKKVIGEYEAPDEFLDLQPVLYTLNEDPLQTPRLGFVAEVVNEVEPLLVVHDEDENGESVPFSIRYENWAVALHSVAKRQARDLREARSSIALLEERIAKLEAK